MRNFLGFFFLLLPLVGLSQTNGVSSVVLEPVRELAVGEPVTLNGFVRSQYDVELPTTVDGELISVLAEGTRVKRGDVIAKVDDRRLELELAEQKLLESRAAITVEYLKGEVDRLSKLQVANLAAKNQLAEIVSRRDLAVNDVQVARSRVSLIKEALDRTTLQTPTDGVVVERVKEVGEFASRGESVVRIVNSDQLEVQVLVPVAYLNRIDSEQPVDVKVAGVEFPARIKSLIQVSDRRSQTYGLIVEVPTEISTKLVAGQFADVTLAITNHSRSLFVPRDAVVSRSEGSFVFKVEAENIAQQVDVIVGSGQGEFVAVRGQLNEGDRVVVRGVESLADGQVVTPTS